MLYINNKQREFQDFRNSFHKMNNKNHQNHNNINNNNNNVSPQNNNGLNIDDMINDILRTGRILNISCDGNNQNGQNMITIQGSTMKKICDAIDRLHFQSVEDENEINELQDKIHTLESSQSYNDQVDDKSDVVCHCQYSYLFLYISSSN